MRAFISVFSSLLISLLLIGCGANPGTPPPQTPASPTPPAAAPSPAPPGSGSSSGSTASTYQVQLVSTEHPAVSVGMVTVDAKANDGAMTVTLNQVVASTTMFVHFCRFGSFNSDCFTIGTVTTDASGNANASLKFPKTGTWAGVFYVSQNDWTGSNMGTSWYQTEPSAYSGNFAVGQNYRVALEPENNVSGGIGQPASPAPLSSGFISISGDTLHAEVHGAAPNTTYTVSFCGATGFTSSCNGYASDATFTTDASGNGSANVKLYSADSEVFFVDPAGPRGHGYVTAFVVQ